MSNEYELNDKLFECHKQYLEEQHIMKRDHFDKMSRIKRDHYTRVHRRKPLTTIGTAIDNYIWLYKRQQETEQS